MNEKIDLTTDKLCSLMLNEKNMNPNLFSDVLCEFILKNCKRLIEEKKDFEMKNCPWAFEGDEYLYQTVKKNQIYVIII